MRDGVLLAAVDLGSNSYRLEIGRYEHGQLHRTAYIKEPLRQGSGLDERRNLTPQAMQRGWDCLARFAERLSGLPRSQVRAVATQTLREARNRDEFLARAEHVLGHPIHVISGAEEARLIYLGVAHLLPAGDERRLVVDIGGRSTELILGQRFDTQALESCRVGSVAWSLKYFPDGRFSREAFSHAVIGAKAVLEEASAAYPPERWDVAYGASGTIDAIGDMLGCAGWPAGHVTLDGLDWLRDRLCAAGHADRVQLDGLRDDRRPVIGGGLSVLRGVFELLQVTDMKVARGALRHGLLYQLLNDASGQTDVASASVRRLALKFAVDPSQTRRVGDVATTLLRQLGAAASSSCGTVPEERVLRWAAQLHEIGALVSHSDFHKHGAYILEHADVLGFTQPDLHRLSMLVLGQRGKLRKLQADFEDVSFVQTLLCLRLAVILCHARRDPDLRCPQLRRSGREFLIELRADWVRAYPQSAHLLREEALAWRKMPWQLRID
jgi:exopolyphosphatase / guanosine-5'-triphosphate,3'-diphosphate pyrophosphatase